jgi:hypothetical protein
MKMAKQSLVSRKTESTGLTLPGAIAEQQTAVPPPLFVNTPYIQFLNAKSPSYPKVVAAIPDVQEGDVVLMGQNIQRLEPARFYVIHARVHYSEVDAAGNVLRSTTDPERASGDKKLAEHIEAVLLVVTPDGLVPARCQFKGARLKAIRNALDTLEEAKTAAWGAKSKEHEASLVSPDARFRFVSTIRVTFQTSRSNGFKYALATSTAKPSGVADWKMVGEFFQDPVNVKLTEAVIESWKERLAHVAGKGA